MNVNTWHFGHGNQCSLLPSAPSFSTVLCLYFPLLFPLSNFLGFVFPLVLYVACEQTAVVCVSTDSFYLCYMSVNVHVSLCVCARARVCIRVRSHTCQSPVRCALSFWVGVSQPAKTPVGKFPISPRCSVQCKLTTKGSEIHSHSKTQASLSCSIALSLSLTPSIVYLSLSQSLSLPHPVSLTLPHSLYFPQMNRSRDEKLSGMLADRQCFTVI